MKRVLRYMYIYMQNPVYTVNYASPSPLPTGDILPPPVIGGYFWEGGIWSYTYICT